VTHTAILDELRQPVKDLHDHVPAVFDGYRSLASATLGDAAPRAFEAFREFTR
jgi:hypothetical protein